MFNVTISNVPGPDKPLYFRGAELLAIYPVSIVTHGQALNITCQSYAGSMNFGFTGCHNLDAEPAAAEGMPGEALEELERAVEHRRAERSARPGSANPRERPAARTAGAKQARGPVGASARPQPPVAPRAADGSRDGWPLMTRPGPGRRR